MNLEVVKSKRGNLLLVRFEDGPATKAGRRRGARGRGRPRKGSARQRRRGKFTPLFVLKKQVTIPARLGFYAEWVGFRPTIKALADRAVAQVLAGMEGTG